ncbi:unnamed protein product [Fraxinus pennsylvanica]|uniref:Uncharacterized protein n=1 Tax=Fraxinus pennsylvanica TaxID=56036 RepID=A0AAD1Z9C8_9LAMI|nr:unnamed protein product [Fraxinus pennsylvanica]
MDKGKNTLEESSGSTLNPYAKPFRPPANVPRFERIPVDRDRTLFRRFSTDFPPILPQEIPANVPRFERIPIDRDRTLFRRFSTDFPPILPQEIPANVPRFERIPIDRDRTLFMKFSTDFPPIFPQEIDDYFTRRFGTCCIESLYVPGRNEGDSQLGIVTFSRILIPYDIMGLREEVVLFICSRPVHFKRYLGRSGVA